MKMIFATLVLVLTTASALAADLPRTPVELKPIRYAKARLVFAKSEMRLEPGQEVPKENTQILCEESIQIPVFDATNHDSFNYRYDNVKCETVFNGQKVTLQAASHILYYNGSPLPMDPRQPLKGAGLWMSIMFANNTTPPSVPTPTPQSVNTRDLGQKNFILTARPDQYMICNSPTPPSNPNHAAPTNSTNCEVHNPVIFFAAVDIEDTP